MNERTNDCTKLVLNCGIWLCDDHIFSTTWKGKMFVTFTIQVF